MIIRLLVIFAFLSFHFPVNAEDKVDAYCNSKMQAGVEKELLKNNSIYKSLIVKAKQDYKAYSLYHKVITAWVEKYYPKLDYYSHITLMVHNKDYYYHFKKYRLLENEAYKSFRSQYDYEYKKIVSFECIDVYEKQFKKLNFYGL